MGKNRPLKPIALSNSRWIAYATAGVATALGSVTCAEAEIHYSGPINAKFTGYKTQIFPLVPNVYIGFKHSIEYDSGFNKIGGNAFFYATSVAGFLTTCALNSSKASVSNLARGDTISAQDFVPRGGILATEDRENCFGQDRGEFLFSGVGFVAFKFNTGSGDQYGWARIEMLGIPRNEFRLIDYAYGDPGDPVRVGQKHDHHEPTLESLGALALGATALLSWRRQRKVTLILED